MRDCSCAPILRFFYMASDGATAERQIYNRIFGQFCTSLRKDSVANYEKCSLQSTKDFIVTSVGGATRIADLRWKFSKTQKNGRRVVPYLGTHCMPMFTIEIVINSTRVMGIRVTMSCRYCIAFEVMVLFSSFICGL